MSAAALVRSALALTLPDVRAAARTLWTAPRLKERYPGYLGVMHGLIRASVPLMEAAGRRCADLPPGDPCAEPLARYFETHIAEEQGHDDWLLKDLTAADGITPRAVLDSAPAADVAALAGAQYYWIRHYHPACLLGYIAVLEGCPPDPDLARRLPGLTGLPATAFRTLAAHAADDPGHLRELDRLLDELPLTPALAAAVAHSAAHTAGRAAALLRGLAQGDPDPASRFPALRS
ncbi:iron-containing redox enzyme family protein [Streptomyces cellulosae]|uniref:iron-containing redox enzyme family protein n=1 Tax=Streptomyces cellulosae TaxID=1968 RepID=UPI0007C72018|nr:iron-containing redox enzyme family protein [Streptomyces cellulosae]